MMPVFANVRNATEILRVAQRSDGYSSSIKIVHRAPGALCAPNAGPQRFKLHNQIVIHEQVDLISVVFDVPLEAAGDEVGGELDHVETKCVP